MTGEKGFQAEGAKSTEAQKPARESSMLRGNASGSGWLDARRGMAGCGAGQVGRAEPPARVRHTETLPLVLRRQKELRLNTKE